MNYPLPVSNIYPIYNNFVRYLEKKKNHQKKEEDDLLISMYIYPAPHIFEVLFNGFSADKKVRYINTLTEYSEDDIRTLIQQIEQKNITDICKRSLNRCFKFLSINEMPDIYIMIGDYTSPAECYIINGKPTIIIFIEFFSDIQLNQKSKEQRYYDARLKGINSLQIIIANQYARLILKQMEVLKNSFTGKLFENGFVSYFTKTIFPEISLAEHLFFTSSELEWCKRNQWFIKRELSVYLHSEDVNIIKKYFLINDRNDNKWLPKRLGCYVGYRIIEEYFKKVYTVSIRDLITLSRTNVISTSEYLNTR